MKKMSRSEKRAVRRDAFRRTAGATTVADGARKRRGPWARIRSRFGLALPLLAFGLVFPVAFVARPQRAMADVNLAPEIDPGSMAGAMTLLIGGVMTLTGRTRRA